MNTVRVFSLGYLRDEASPWRVKWTVDGRPKTRAKRTKAEAELLRSRLLTAAAAGEQFDPRTGEPMSWTQTTMTFADLTHAYAGKKWKKWSAASRRSFVDAVSVSVTALVSEKSRGRPDAKVLSTAVRNYLVTPTGHRVGDPSPEQEQALAWMERASLPLSLITVDAVEETLDVISLKQNGDPVAPSTLNRRRQALHVVLEYAVKKAYLKENPMDRTEWEAETPSIEVDSDLVLSPDQCRAAQAQMAALSPAAARFEALVATLWLAGLRPSEAAHLTVSDLTLPDEGWGRIRVSGASVEVGKQWTNTGERADKKGLKWRKKGDVRQVPIPPELVAVLNRHVDKYELKDSDLLFTAARGGTISSSSIGRHWDQVRCALFPEGDRLRKLPLYWLRHTNASILLEAGVSPVEAARRLGHSPEVLLRIYAGVMRGFEEHANARVDSLLTTSSAE